MVLALGRKDVRDFLVEDNGVDTNDNSFGVNYCVGKSPPIFYSSNFSHALNVSSTHGEILWIFSHCWSLCP